MILDPYSDSEIKVPDKSLPAVIGRALGGEITGKIGRIDGLTLGKYQIPGVIANYPDPNSYMDTLKASTVERNGSIGGEVLSRFTVIFNYPKDKIYLKKNSSFKKPFQTNLCGISVKAKGARLKTFEIIEVRKNSVAEEGGILIGDLISSVNGRPVSEFNLNELTGELSTKPGRKLTLELQRKGEAIRKTLILREDI
jgi:membrane-associated protease RseP (regulator of RpoE activity)